MADKKSNPQQIAQAVYEVESNSISVRDATNLVPSQYNEIVFNYINTNPEPSTVTYKLNNTVIAILSFEYDVRGRVIRVIRTA